MTQIRQDHKQMPDQHISLNPPLLATDIPNLAWSKITSGKPTTLAGYGITNAYTTPVAQAVTGSKGSNDALASLITALVTLGLITDSTT
jgi:hypothetical protein